MPGPMANITALGTGLQIGWGMAGPVPVTGPNPAINPLAAGPPGTAGNILSNFVPAVNIMAKPITTPYIPPLVISPSSGTVCAPATFLVGSTLMMLSGMPALTLTATGMPNLQSGTITVAGAPGSVTLLG